jgi:hypothetical protein
MGGGFVGLEAWLQGMPLQKPVRKFAGSRWLAYRTFRRPRAYDSRLDAPAARRPGRARILARRLQFSSGEAMADEAPSNSKE